MTSLALLLGLALVVGIGLRTLTAGKRQQMGSSLGALVQFALGLGVCLLITYVVLYFLTLVGGFYESLTCKVVTLPACEDPLFLPAWLRLPEQSVGGLIGVLPLVAVFLAKVLQPRLKELEPDETLPWYTSAAQQGLHWLANNAGIILILIIEVWLAALRGQAEAADREVRIALGLDQELPAIYLSIARWGAVVLALGLSAVVIYLGILTRYSRILAVDALARLNYGAALVGLVGGLVQLVANALVSVWTLAAIALGRFALKAQSFIFRLWSIILIAVGRFFLKAQSFLYRSWAFVATTLGWTVLSLWRMVRRSPRRGLEAVLFVSLLGAGGISYATTYVVLFDATGSEAERIEETRQTVLSWADPSPQRALLKRGDRLIVIPIVAPGNLDPTYSALFNAAYPSNQLERYAFFTTLRDALPQAVDDDAGTGLSESLRAANVYLEEAEDARVLVVFGNGEDHSPEPVDAQTLNGALVGATVLHLNLGLGERQKWLDLYQAAGAEMVVSYDLAATRSLTQGELKEALGLD